MISTRLLAACFLAAATVALAAEALPDPTRPADFTPGPDEAIAERLALQSILISPNRRQAIINGQAVKVGDHVGSSKVVEIGRDKVVLVNGRETETLRLLSDRDVGGIAPAGMEPDSRKRGTR